MDLLANLRAIVSQRLVRTSDGKGRKAAFEILINTPTIAERIFKGEFKELKDIMDKSRELGMRKQLQIDKDLRFSAACPVVELRQTAK